MPTRKSLHPPSAQRAPSPPPTFVAIDFETADYGRDSDCALARGSWLAGERHHLHLESSTVCEGEFPLGTTAAGY